MIDPPSIAPTKRLYLDDSRLLSAGATVVAVRDDGLAFDRTCFFPGGGGQPSDTGSVAFPDGTKLEVVVVQADGAGVLWHQVAQLPPSSAIVGAHATLTVDGTRRRTLTRHHTALHVLNTVALRDYGAWITGVQIGEEQSRIDFKIEGLSPATCIELEQKVNAVIAANLNVRSHFIAEAEFLGRDDLLRTLEARPPVVDGRVRIVEIEGFDAQACGGTHVVSTGEIGRFTIFRTENKGRINKRLYVRLDEPAG